MINGIRAPLPAAAADLQAKFGFGQKTVIADATPPSSPQPLAYDVSTLRKDPRFDTWQTRLGDFFRGAPTATSRFFEDAGRGTAQALERGFAGPNPWDILTGKVPPRQVPNAVREARDGITQRQAAENGARQIERTEQDIPLVGRFPRLVDAGKAAVCAANPASVRAGLEMGNWIVRNRDGSFGYLPPLVGDATSVATPVRPPAAVGHYHTHGSGRESDVGGEFFSKIDLKFSRTHDVRIFLGTPTGAVKQYRHNEGPIEDPMSPCPR